MNVKSVTEVDDAVVARVSEVLEFAFPGQKFEVLKVCDSGVYNMINVYWLDGPTEAEVRFITRAFEGKNGLRFVHESREFSNEFVQECIDRLRQKYGCVFRSIRSRIGIEVRSAIRIHSINRELNFFYRFLTRFFAAFHYRGIFPQ